MSDPFDELAYSTKNRYRTVVVTKITVYRVKSLFTIQRQYCLSENRDVYLQLHVYHFSR